MVGKNLWVEKYRPTTFAEIVDQAAPIEMLSSFVSTGQMPHIIITGPPGTGKTSAAHILTRSMFPKEILDDRVLELNASEERGIRTVRGKIKRFVSCSLAPIRGVPDLSIVILDEADALTLDSQFALRRVIEDHCRHSRFILICNYLNRIITPLLSRCSVIHFHNLLNGSIKTILDRVCSSEGVPLDIQESIELKGCDARRAINLLQKKVSDMTNGNTTSFEWKTIVGMDHNALIEEVEDMLLDGKDIDRLIESFVEWACAQPGVNPMFVKNAMSICCNVANHGTPVIQLTTLILWYRAFSPPCPSSTGSKK